MQQGDWFESDYSIQALEQLSIFKPIDESLIDDYMSYTCTANTTFSNRNNILLCQ